MTSDEWRKIKQKFNQAYDLPENERAGFLDKVDEKLRLEVEKLLDANKKADNFIVEPAVIDAGFAAGENENDLYVGKQIGDYRVLKEIGHGGMGTVYLAVKSDESFDKKVAIKLIKRGMDTAAVLKRFMMERKILAQLEHPYIASLFDGGSTRDGLPYLVMEYIEGKSITRFCDAHEYGLKERLQLFRKVCSAVAFAHQNLVVHRDIKPSNILVTSDGIPKLLDFGIAKLLNPEWSVETRETTATIYRVMTPEYAAPEQIRGGGVTTGADVYSLGVVLYELLSGHRPYKSAGYSPEDLFNAILTEEPPRPSSVVSRPSQAEENKTSNNEGQRTKDEERRTNPKSAIPNPKSLRGDLDNIILKALRKEPERRYLSVQEFSEDIGRHLEGLPVKATADTISYRLTKFIRRHRAGVLVSGLMILTLMLATIITSWQAVVAQRERDRAEQHFKQVRNLTNSFMFEFHDSIRDLPGSVGARELVMKKALEYLDSLATEQANDSSLKFELATAYKKVGDIQGRAQSSNLGDTKGALESYQKAKDIFLSLYGSDPANVQYRVELAGTYLEIAQVDQIFGHYEAALENNNQALILWEKQIAADPGDISSKTSLAHCYKIIGDLVASKGDLETALQNYRKDLEVSEAVLKIDPENEYARGMLAAAYDAIGTTLGNPNYTNLGDAAGALETYRKQLELCTQSLDRDKNNAQKQHAKAFTLKNMGEVLTTTGDWKAALENYQQSFAIYQNLSQADSKDAYINATLAYLQTNIGEALAETDQIEAALRYHRQAIDRLTKLSGTDAGNSTYLTYLARAHQRNGDALVKAKKIAEGLEAYQKALANDEQMAGEDLENMDIRLALAQDYAKLGAANFLMAGNSSDKKIELIREARKRFEQSRAVYLDMQAHNLKTKPITDSINNLRSEIARCDQILAK